MKVYLELVRNISAASAEEEQCKYQQFDRFASTHRLRGFLAESTYMQGFAEDSLKPADSSGARPKPCTFVSALVSPLPNLGEKPYSSGSKENYT